MLDVTYASILNVQIVYYTVFALLVFSKTELIIKLGHLELVALIPSKAP
jgi:hypothetical protein